MNLSRFTNILAFTLIIVLLWFTESTLTKLKTDKIDLQKDLCEYSVHNTRDMKIIDGDLYCRTSENTIERLTHVIKQ